MKFSVKRDLLLKSLNFVQGVVEKKNTLPILSNVLLEVKNNKLTILATDLDILFSDEISDLKTIEEGSTTTSANVLYDILRKISSNSEIHFDLKSENKLSLNAENSDFNLLCLPTDNFPTFTEDFINEETEVPNKYFLSLLNKAKISISNDDTRHYLNGIFLHITKKNYKAFIEVKNVTLSRTRGLAEFPDSITSRGLKHINELIKASKKGYEIFILYLIQREDCKSFTIANDIDADYANSLSKAIKKKLNILCYDCKFSPKGIKLNQIIKYKIR